MIDFSTYKFRCSSLGKIVTSSGTLTDASKTYLKELHVCETYGIEHNITSKYFEKGICNEQDAIEMLNKVIHPNLFLAKNKIRMENEWIHGELDVDVQPAKIVYDTKIAWDLFTFGNAKLTHDYEVQLKGYCWLRGYDHGRLFYCLTDMPEHLIIKEETSLYYKGGFNDTADPNYIEACLKLRKAYDYSFLPLEAKFKMWDVWFTEEDIEKIKHCVNMARLFLCKLEKDRLETLIKNKKIIESARQ